ncbi:MAG: hypothetical protein WCE68_11015 [Anaerolineales bacterium]
MATIKLYLPQLIPVVLIETHPVSRETFLPAKFATQPVTFIYLTSL